MIADFNLLDQLRRQRPLIHCIANQVSSNDCANVLLAAGASPIMALAPEELSDITAASRATVLNTGTPEAKTFHSCLCWGQAAFAAGQPIVLDPVGVGASRWRSACVQELLLGFTPQILRVNLGEAQALIQRAGREQGVDSTGPASREERLAAANALAQRTGSAVLLSGPEDIVTDGTAAWCVSGGSPRMTRVTGTGCMLSCLCGAFAAVTKDALQATLVASAFWKVCSQQAEQLTTGRGIGSYRTALLDAADTLTVAELSAEAQITCL